ncbi:hypothetical protein [Vibrio phage MZH0603]|nr:hypothetical protein [Vibrio phage MZH0603]
MVVLAQIIVVVVAVASLAALIVILLETGFDVLAQLLAFILFIGILFTLAAGVLWAVETLQFFMG